MKPDTLINWLTAATIATASPAWGCEEQPASHHSIAPDKIVSNIVNTTPAQTEIISTSFARPNYSGYDLLKMDLKAYLSLEDGWDGPGSKAASEQAIAMAISFVDELPSGIPLPKPMLSLAGEVGLYWDIGEIYADVDFEEKDTISIFVRDRRDTKLETFNELALSDARASQLRDILSPLIMA
jgi:hypothetical protein